MACWGDNSSGQATPPAASFIQVSAGASHACGLVPDQSLACWGLEAIAETPNSPPVVNQISAPVDPVPVNGDVTVAAGFTDPDLQDTHTALLDWGDGSSSTGVVTEANGSGALSANHTYTTAGVYTLSVTVTDERGGTGSGTFEYVIVYDVNSGFVTGAGAITSPPGALGADATATGLANFAFTAKYQRGATIPTGATQFRLNSGRFSFASDTFQWLVIGGARAEFKGTGRVNGTGGYGFRVTLVDADLPGGGGADRFRIKVWDTATGQVVYDLAARAVALRRQFVALSICRTSGSAPS